MVVRIPWSIIITAVGTLILIGVIVWIFSGSRPDRFWEKAAQFEAHRKQWEEVERPALEKERDIALQEKGEAQLLANAHAKASERLKAQDLPIQQAIQDAKQQYEQKKTDAEQQGAALSLDELQRIVDTELQELCRNPKYKRLCAK